MTQRFFLLWEGQSEDGRGYPTFKTFTEDAAEAKKHWESCKKNPYSTGLVRVMTKNSIEEIRYEHEWASFIPKERNNAK